MNSGANRRALVVGATGLVGGHLLTRLAEHPGYGEVATLGRRAPGFRHPQVTHHVVDLANPDTDVVLSGTDVLFCCLGTTIKQAGSRAAFRAIDYELVVKLASQAVTKGTDTCVVVSSVGADANSSNFYLRTKGEMEQAIADLGYKRLGLMRPSLLLGTRAELRPAERAGQIAARLVNPLMLGSLSRYRAVDAETVAAAMIGFDLSASAGVQVIEGREIPRLARE